MEKVKKTVYFIGAGPGDPELITVKGARIIREADTVIYTGSLVNPRVVGQLKEGCSLYDSSGMTLEEVMEIILRAVERGETVARVHTGDPSIYGAVREQVDILESQEISYEIVPGVSSFLSAAASLGKEYTLPGVSQTVILTRVEGRTPVPQGEKLRDLAGHGASMVIFLSVQMIEKVVEELLFGYEKDTPVAVVQRASWPEEKVITGTLMDIASRVKEAKIDRTALILIGRFLGDKYELSRLYDKAFSHGYREGEK